MAGTRHVISGIYRHYKGGLYHVLGVATHTETSKPLVVYHDDSRKIWARPLKMFTNSVSVDGKKVPRFSLVER